MCEYKEPSRKLEEQFFCEDSLYFNLSKMCLVNYNSSSIAFLKEPFVALFKSIFVSILHQIKVA